MKIAIASGKGGTGKTTISVNLASVIAEQFKWNVILADLDVEEPNSGLFLDNIKISQRDKFVMVPSWDEEKCTHCGKCTKLCRFNALVKIPSEVMVFEELCHNCYLCSELCPSGALVMKKKKIGEINHYKSGKLDFVEGVLDVGIEKSVPLIKHVKEYIDDRFEDNSIVIFDSPPGTSCPMIEAVKDVDLTILVTEPTPFGLHDLKLAVETAKNMGLKYAVVINRYDTGDDDTEIWCKNNNIPILGRIAGKREIAELYSAGKLLYDNYPDIELEMRNIFIKAFEMTGVLYE